MTASSVLLTLLTQAKENISWSLWARWGVFLVWNEQIQKSVLKRKKKKNQSLLLDPRNLNNEKLTLCVVFSTLQVAFR